MWGNTKPTTDDNLQAKLVASFEPKTLVYSSATATHIDPHPTGRAMSNPAGQGWFVWSSTNDRQCIAGPRPEPEFAFITNTLNPQAAGLKAMIV